MRADTMAERGRQRFETMQEKYKLRAETVVLCGQRFIRDPFRAEKDLTVAT